MIRNLKMLGVLAIAALALSAMAASAAQAQAGKITTGITPSTHTATTLHGEQEGNSTVNFFEALKVKITCDTATYTDAGKVGTPGTYTEATFAADFKDCEAPVVDKPATVNTTSCRFTFTQPSTSAGKQVGLVDNVCNAGDFVDVTVFPRGVDETPKNTAHPNINPWCHIRVLPKNNLTNVTYTHSATKTPKGFDDLTVDAAVTNLDVTAQGECTAGLHLTTTAGKFNSTVTLLSASDTDDVWTSE